MGLFSKFNKSTKESERKDTVAVPWHALTTKEQLSEINQLSKTTPVTIFKHSTRCGISRMVLRNFESTYSLTNEQMKLYFLDLLAYRDVSDEVGYTFQVMHQSPQVIVIKNGIAVAHASHHGIRAEELHNFI